MNKAEYKVLFFVFLGFHLMKMIVGHFAQVEFAFSNFVRFFKLPYQTIMSIICRYLKVRGSYYHDAILMYSSVVVNCSYLYLWTATRQWASWQIRKILVHASQHVCGRYLTRSPWASCQIAVTHVPWCMTGYLTSGFLFKSVERKTFPAFPAHAQRAIFRIWQEARATFRR